MLKSIQKRKNRLRKQRKSRVRGKVFGTKELPRLTVYRSNRHFYAQAIDDTSGSTLACVDGRKMGLKANKDDVAKIAQKMAEELSSKKIKNVIFDRNGYLYHGVIAAFAQGLREAGIKL